MIPKVVGSFSKRPVPKRGAISSDDYNDTFDDLIADLNQIFSSWNQYIQPLLDSLPSGDSPVALEDRVSGINPFVNGLDGSQFYLDQTAAEDVDDGYFFDSDLERPLTVKEALEKVEDDLNVKINNINNQLGLIDAATGLTTSMKARIGMNIFDEDETSSSDSLDGLTQMFQQYFLQLSADIFNESPNSGIGEPSHYAWTGSAQTYTKSIMDLINEVSTADIPEARVTGLVADLAALGAADTALTTALTLVRTNLIGSSVTLTDGLVGWTPGLNYIVAADSLKEACEALDTAVAAVTSEEILFTDTVTTNDAAETLLLASDTIPDNTEAHVEVKIMAVYNDRSNADNWHVERQFYRAGGVLTVRDGLGILNNAGLTGCTIDVRVNANTFAVYVTGIAATIINWKCVGKYFTD